MNEFYISIKKNLYELFSAIGLLFLFYFKNKFLHDYFSYRGFFQSSRFKILKIEKLSQLIALTDADRAILYELEGEYFYPTAYSLKEGISFQGMEKFKENILDKMKLCGIIESINSEISFSTFNPTKQIQYSVILDSEIKPKAILFLHFFMNPKELSYESILLEFNIKIKDILQMEKQESKKLIGVMINLLQSLIKLLSIKNILRILLMILNFQIIHFELSKETYSSITIPILGVPTEIPLVLVFFLAAITNAGILEGIIFLYSKIIKWNLTGGKI